MTLESVTFHLPSQLYQEVKQRAHATRRSFEDELLATVKRGLTDDPVDISPATAEELAQLPFLDDAQLWRAARMAVSSEKAERMQTLALQVQAEGLTEAEEREARQLRRYAQRVMLVRAEAAALLKERGLDISSLRQRPAR